MRKHPVLLGILLLCLMGVLFFLLVYGVASLTGDKSTFSMKDKIGVVVLKGIILDSRVALTHLEKCGRDEGIKAIVLRIESPGGGVTPAQEIYEKIQSVKKKKKVVVSMGSMAASGGYYVACAADKIVANPGTVTGSIGVIMHFTNVQDLFKKIGLKSSVIKSGRYKDTGSPFRDMSPEEKVLLQGVLDDIHDQFLDTVSTSRGIPKEKLKEIADGRIMTGRQALQMGLVDYLGDIEFAADVAARLSGIEGKPELVYPKEERFTIWRYMLEEMVSILKRELAEEGVGFSYLYQTTGD
jgi:protease-4